MTKTPLTPEDYTKGITIPEGGKVTNVENIPDLTTPGKKDPVKVTVELPNGKVVTVEVPVNVTPVKEIETPVTKTPLTPEDYTKGITIPEGGKVTNVENIPDLTTPGKKDPVKVTVELPNGKVITVEVPVTVTPINEIIKNVGDPITNEDVEKNVKIPEGAKIVSIGDKPGTETPGVKPVVPVVIELPNGKQITVEVPVIVKPKVSTIIVPQGTVITPEDVKNHIDLPKEPGWEIVEVGEIPSTIPAGVKPSVKVKVKLPNGKVIELEVPVISTPKANPESQTYNGGGNGGSNYRPAPQTPQTPQPAGPTAPEQPAAPTAPAEPGQPATPNQTQPAAPAQADATVATDTTAKPATPKYVEGQKELPNTGTEAHAGLAALGLLGALSGFGLLSRKKKED